MLYKFPNVMNVSEVAFDILVSEAAIVGFCHQTPSVILPYSAQYPPS